MIDQPGIYQISAAEYHADPCPAPSLSSSIARLLLSASPQHAWFAHPRLNPAYAPEASDKFDLGTAAHAYILQGESGFVIVDAPDWRTKAAKEARDQARAAGKIPLLADRWGDVQGMAVAARAQLEAFEDPPRPLGSGQPEQTLVWREDGLWCRARLDWLHADHQTIDDLKTTSASANPERWTRGPLYDMGNDLQAAFYLRGLKVLFGIDATFRFVVVESTLPYALSVIGLGPEALALAEQKRSYALRLWGACLERDAWPAYPTVTCWAEAPPWESARWLEHEALTDRTPVDDGRPLADQLMGG